MNRLGRSAAIGTLMLLAGTLATADASAAGSVGKVERLRGTANIELPGGRSHALAVGDAVEESQSVHTGPDSEAVVRFADNALMIVRPGTQVRITTYRYRQDDPGSTSLIRLVRGGLRFITGLTGKLNHDNVRFDTPVATIGIRGTDFDTVYREEKAEGLDAGSYTCVTEGGTYMRDTAGQEVEIAQGQTGFMTSADFIAKGVAAASSIGVIKPPPGLFHAGTFDGQMQELRDEGMRQMQNRIDQNVPTELRGVLPGAEAVVSGAGKMLGGLFKKGKDKLTGGGNPCAS